MVLALGAIILYTEDSQSPILWGTTQHHWNIAQLAERLAVNQNVVGSIPAIPAPIIKQLFRPGVRGHLRLACARVAVVYANHTRDGTTRFDSVRQFAYR
jgi:hypothetical protein